MLLSLNIIILVLSYFFDETARGVRAIDGDEEVVALWVVEVSTTTPSAPSCGLSFLSAARAPLSVACSDDTHVTTTLNDDAAGKRTGDLDRTGLAADFFFIGHYPLVEEVTW